MYMNKDKLWSILSVIGIIASTSKSAYIILVILTVLYLIQNKHYLTIIFVFMLFFGTVFQVNEFYNYLRHEEIQDYYAFQSFVQSIKGYFILTNNTIVMDSIEVVRQGKTVTRDFSFFVEDGPFIEFYNYSIHYLVLILLFLLSQIRLPE